MEQDQQCQQPAVLSSQPCAAQLDVGRLLGLGGEAQQLLELTQDMDSKIAGINWGEPGQVSVLEGSPKPCFLLPHPGKREFPSVCASTGYFMKSFRHYVLEGVPSFSGVSCPCRGAEPCSGCASFQEPVLGFQTCFPGELIGFDGCALSLSVMGEKPLQAR